MRIEITNIKRFFRQCDQCRSSKAAHITGSIARTLLALTFLFSGFVKCVDPLGTVYKVEDYLTAMGGFMADMIPAAGVFAVLLILAEWILGWAMLFNIRTKWTVWGALAFMLVMTPITLWIALTNAVEDCGCFGDAIKLSNWQTFYKNIVLLLLVLILLFCKKGIPQLFSWWAELTLFLIGLGISAGIMGYGYTHLPIIDFRPYKVGNNIMELTEDGVAPKIDVFYTFEKEGESKEFLYKDRPDLNGDSTWTFKFQETRVLQEGKEPTINDFRLESIFWDSDSDDESQVPKRYIYLEDDLTYDILESEYPVTLIVMYDLSKRDRKQAARAVQLYKDIKEQGGICFFLTGSGEEDLFAFAEETGIDINTGSYLYMDATPIKTIVRANPGVVVLQNGVVKEKHNMRQL